MKHIIALAIVVSIIASFFIFSVFADEPFFFSMGYYTRDSSGSSSTLSYAASTEGNFRSGVQAISVDRFLIYPNSHYGDVLISFKVGAWALGENLTKYAFSGVSGGFKSFDMRISGGSYNRSTAQIYTVRGPRMPDLSGYTPMNMSAVFFILLHIDTDATQIILDLDNSVDLSYTVDGNYTYGFFDVDCLYNYNNNLDQIFGRLVLSYEQFDAFNTWFQSSFASHAFNLSNLNTNLLNISYSCINSTWSGSNFSTSNTFGNWFNSVNNNLYTLASETALQHQLQDKVNDHGAETSYESFAGQSQFSSVTSFSGIQKAANFNSSQLATESTNFLTLWFSQLCKDDIDAVAGTRIVGQLDIVDFIGNRREDDYVESD